MPGQPYNDTFIPTMAKYAARGTSFTGTTSFGLPTADGWLGLIVGLNGNLRGLNMIRNVAGHDDSFMRRNRE